MPFNSKKLNCHAIQAMDIFIKDEDQQMVISAGGPI